MVKTHIWVCLSCSTIYDEAFGDPKNGVAPNTAWADVPMNWTCPECRARKDDFETLHEQAPDLGQAS